MKKFLSREDNVLMLNNGTIQQVVVTDVTITCPMTFTSFPFDTQSCPFEILDVERPPLDFFRMVTSEIQFSEWPRPFSPTASEFEYQVFWAKPCSRELITFWYWCQFFRFPTTTYSWSSNYKGRGTWFTSPLRGPPNLQRLFKRGLPQKQKLQIPSFIPSPIWYGNVKLLHRIRRWLWCIWWVRLLFFIFT